MPDNVNITPGTGATVATDERTIATIPVQVQRVDEIGTSAIAHARGTVGTAAATISAARETRRRITVMCDKDNTGAIWVGGPAVTISNGFLLMPGAALTLETTQAIGAIGNAASQGYYVIEEFDS